LETTLLCLEDFEGKPKDAEEACLEELKLSGVACDPSLLLPEGNSAKRDKHQKGDEDCADQADTAMAMAMAVAIAIAAKMATEAAEQDDDKNYD
jgi:hypothetical protein